jgi:hypothetical protein
MAEQRAAELLREPTLTVIPKFYKSQGKVSEISAHVEFVARRRIFLCFNSNLCFCFICLYFYFLFFIFIFIFIFILFSFLFLIFMVYNYHPINFIDVSHSCCYSLFLFLMNE